ncbi:MAG TPA: hypothetical protein VHE12_00360 [bacterium]|nr:hypothetical protein [bacterium]
MRTARITALGALALFVTMPVWGGFFDDKPQPRLVMFIGVDQSGSFLKGPDFDDSIQFLSHYIYGHLKGLEGMTQPAALFVGSIGGDKKGEPKVFFPIETFQDKTPEEIEAKLREIFPKDHVDKYTDYNAFFQKVTEMVKDRNMVLKPLAVVMVSDGMLDVPGNHGRHDFRGIDLSPLEKLSRNVTVRLLYTDPTVGKKWEGQVPRRRVKVWTQEAPVMETWKDPKIYNPDGPMEKQDKFIRWVKNNVDFGVRMKRVD